MLQLFVTILKILNSESSSEQIRLAVMFFHDGGVSSFFQSVHGFSWQAKGGFFVNQMIGKGY